MVRERVRALLQRTGRRGHLSSSSVSLAKIMPSIWCWPRLLSSSLGRVHCVKRNYRHSLMLIIQEWYTLSKWFSWGKPITQILIHIIYNTLFLLHFIYGKILLLYDSEYEYSITTQLWRGFAYFNTNSFQE